MKKIKILTIAALILGFSTTAFAQTNPSEFETATAGATIIKPIAIEKIEDLEFGNIIASSTGGTVKITPSGDITHEGVAAPTGLANTYHAAEFKVTGEGTSKYSINIEQTTALTSATGGDDMNLSLFTHNADSQLSAGTETFKVGATLTINADQKAGRYEGEFKVTVNYE